MDEELRALRVLVIEDELLIRWSLCEALSARGMQADGAADGTSAIRLLAADQVSPLDVIVLDYRLPDSNDFELLSLVRRLAPGTNVILMTAFGSPEIVEGALALGVWRVVNKPFDLADMATMVVDAAARRRQT
jgi:DNA-binding NtrC family response regulator